MTIRNRGTPTVQTAPVVKDYSTVSSNATVLPSTADVHLLTLGASVTLTFDTNAVPDRTTVRFYLAQDGTGSRNVTWSGVTWLSGSAPTLTTTASALDILEFVYVSSATSNNWYGRPVYTKTTTFPGNVTIAGTLEVDSDFSVNTNKFTVTASSGNTVIAGTVSIAGNIAVNTTKFTIAAASGNTTCAGTLTIGGNFTASSDNAFDLGAVSSGRFRDGFFGRNLAIGGTLSGVTTGAFSGTITSTNTSTGFQWNSGNDAQVIVINRTASNNASIAWQNATSTDWQMGQFPNSLSTGRDFIMFNQAIGIAMRFDVASANVAIGGAVSTAQPSGNGAGKWKLGKKITAAAALDAAHYVEVDVDGTLLKFLIST